jgi:hypothetical protein
MSEELTIVEELVMELLLDLMTKRVMSERGIFVGVQASSTRTVQESSLTTREKGPS